MTINLTVPLLFSKSGYIFNTVTANDKYTCYNKENLLLPLQMQLLEKQKNCYRLFIAFVESTLNSEDFHDFEDGYLIS